MKGMITLTVKEKQLLNSIEEAQERIQAIYEDLDELSGFLGEIDDALEKNTDDITFRKFHDEWLMFPTHHTLDNLTTLLNTFRSRYGEK